MRARSFLLSVMPFLLLALACGSSSSNVASGGVGGSGVSKGPVSDFGSVFVTGIEWNTDSAEILVNGIPGSEASLDLGMIVIVEGTVANDGLTGTATTVSFDDDLEGPIDSITPVGSDGTAATIAILGVDVYVEDGFTVFFDDESSFDFASMMEDDVVEVSGLRDADGTIRATYIEREGTLAPGTTEVKLEGFVSGFTGGSSFQIGSVTVNFDPFGVTTDLSDLPGNAPSDGQFVEVEGIVQVGGDITADKIEEEDPLPDVDNAEIEGVITRFVSLADMDVARQLVDASGATQVPEEPGPEALYRLGAVVEVEGPLTGGVLIARELKLRGFDTRIEAAIAADDDIDAENGTFVLLGIPVRTDASTGFDDGVADLPDFSVADLMAGDFVSVRGVENPTGTLYATWVKREDVDDVRLRGFLEAIDNEFEGAETLTVMGVTVDVSGASFEDENENPLTLAEFFGPEGAQIDDLVKMKNDLPGDPTVLTFATDVELKTPESGEAGLPPSFFPGVVAAQPAVPSVAATLDDLGAFGPAPTDELQRVEDLDFEFDDAAPLVDSAEQESTTKGSDSHSMVDAVVVFFERLREVAAAEASAAVSED